MNFEELCSVIRMRSSSAYCEGDGQVDLISDVGHVSLPEETGQADLGTIYRENKQSIKTVSDFYSKSTFGHLL